MAASVEHSYAIDKPVSKVFHFIAHEHVRNHPRWDSVIELERTSDDPIGVGTVIRRINRRSGTAVEGTMEVVEFEPDTLMGVVIHDGPMEVRSRISFEAIGKGETKVTTYVELPGMDASMDTSLLKSALAQSAENQRRLMEAEI